MSALLTLASALPRDFPAPVLVALHIGSYPSSLPELLSHCGPLRATHAADGEPIAAGQIHVARRTTPQRIERSKN